MNTVARIDKQGKLSGESNRRADRKSNRRTDLKQCGPDLSIRGKHKKKGSVQRACKMSLSCLVNNTSRDI